MVALKIPKGGVFARVSLPALFVPAPVEVTLRTYVYLLSARTHALSSYVPMCRHCGLILCTLNPPYCACPHCASTLLDEREREALVRRFEGELAGQITKEEADRQKVIEEARAAEGAFPTLPGLQAQLQTARTSRTPPPPPTTRTVLSLNSGTKRVTVSSYSTPTVTPSRPASRGQDREEPEGRVLGPPWEVRYVKEQSDPGRPWKNMRAVDVRYVPLPREATGDTNKQGRKKKKGGERGTAAGGTPDR